tara:strand:+ start:2343 stop:3410 length:1068 start_codon:yes stop_codon:yes gene_type:complete
MEIEEESHLSIEIPEHTYLTNISFSGGGFRGLAFLGCVKALQEKDVLKNVTSYAGSSVGAFIATLVVCGADYQYLKDVATGACQFFGNFKMDIFSILTSGTRLGSSFGMYRTEDLREYLKTCIQNVLKCENDPTFEDLYARNPVELIITASCLETRTPFYFSYSTTKDTAVSEALAISCSIPLLFGKNMYDNKTLVDGCLIEKLPMQCWPQEEIENTMAFLLESKERKINTNTFIDYIHAIESTMLMPQEDGYISKYKNAITTINAGNLASHGTMPTAEEISRVIYAAYFKTLSELSRRNFIDEYSIPKSQEISTLIMAEESSILQGGPLEKQTSFITTLIIILLIVTIVKIITL